MNNSINKIGKYLRELSVVVLGVAITLSASVWISSKNEKRDIALHLQAIRMELEENAKDIGDIVEFLKPTVRYVTYLQSHNKKSLNKDTLASYATVVYTVSPMATFKTNAFEMFRNSGTMRLMNDRELLLAIWNVYDELTFLKQLSDEHVKRHWNYMEKDMSLIDVDDEEIEFGRDIIPMYDFYRKAGGFNAIVVVSEKFLNDIEEMIVRLDETEVIKHLKTSEFKSTAVTDEDLDKYLGVYSSDQVPVIMTITKAYKRLYVQATGQPALSLDAIAEHKFKIRNAGTGVILEFNPTDKTIILHQDGEIYNFVREE